MDLILVHPPYRIALACIYIASVHREKDITAWFEDLHEDMNLVSHSSKRPDKHYLALAYLFKYISYWCCPAKSKADWI